MLRTNHLRPLVAAVLLSAAASLPAAAQTMRFETTAGSFDMVLNPTNDPNLKPLVDNIVAYIGLGRYHYTAINRADEGFVLQMGSFLGFPPTPNDYLNLVQQIDRLQPVVTDANADGQVDFAAGSNARGTVSLALSSDGPNSGTSSFFINLGDNTGLDSQGFVPFAQIPNMTTVDRIMGLNQTNLTGDPNDLTFGDVPLMENGRLVILKSVHVLQAAPDFSFTGPTAAALDAQAQADEASEAMQAAQLAADLAASAAANSADVPASAAAVMMAADASASAGAAVPEPTGAALAAFAAAALASAAGRNTARRGRS